MFVKQMTLYIDKPVSEGLNCASKSSSVKPLIANPPLLESRLPTPESDSFNESSLISKFDSFSISNVTPG